MNQRKIDQDFDNKKQSVLKHTVLLLSVTGSYQIQISSNLGDWSWIWTFDLLLKSLPLDH